jgi:predicted Zn finger-like uncharacterized protein
MLTQCPHCLTLFRLGPEQLKAADGQVRCCRCHQVFNALESLQEAPTSFTNTSIQEAENDLESPLDSELQTTPEPVEPDTPESWETDDWLLTQEETPQTHFDPILPSPELKEESQTDIDEILEKDDGLEPAPDYLDIGTESQMSELLDQDSSSLLLPDSEYSVHEAVQDEDRTESAKVVAFTGPSLPQPSEELEAAATEETGPFETHDFEDSILKDEAIDEELGKPDYDSVPSLREDETTTEPQAGDDRALRFEAVESPRPRNRLQRSWLIGCLLLLIPLSGQLAWHFRDSLIYHNAGRQTLSLVCSVAGCQVPVRRNLEQIIISGRNLSTHPEKSDTLQLQLSLINTAPFEQPFPQLTLSLFNDNGSLIARRTFTTDQYLPQENNQTQLMPRAQSVLVQIDLVDPGNEVTGFSFDFY